MTVATWTAHRCGTQKGHGEVTTGQRIDTGVVDRTVPRTVARQMAWSAYVKIVLGTWLVLAPTALAYNTDPRRDMAAGANGRIRAANRPLAECGVS